MSVSSKLHKLTELAKEKSSDRRRELLREVTDLFFDAPPAGDSAAQGQFDDILQTLANETAQDARAELADRFADAPFARFRTRSLSVGRWAPVGRDRKLSSVKIFDENLRNSYRKPFAG